MSGQGSSGTGPFLGKSFIMDQLLPPLMRYTRFEKARVIGARGLQIALGAPVLIVVPESYVDPIEIATLEYEEGMIPISIKK